VYFRHIAFTSQNPSKQFKLCFPGFQKDFMKNFKTQVMVSRKFKKTPTSLLVIIFYIKYLNLPHEFLP